VTRKRSRFPKMSNEDKQGVLHELDAWCRRERAGRLTWARLEELSGFTRQALSSHPEIVERYGRAKVLNRPGSQEAAQPRETTDQRILDLQRDVDNLKALLNRYDERWARYARNAALLGYDLDRLGEPMDPPARAVVRIARSNRRA